MSAEAQGAPKPEPEPEPAGAWQPFTFGGVAAWANAGVMRLLAAELAAAILVAVSVVWFLHRAYWPVILQTIQKMPETARVANGALQGVPETLMAESQFLAIVVTPKPGGEIGQDADLQIQLRPNDVCAGSIFWPDWGWEMEYGRGASVNLARTNLEPWWSAWQPVLLAGAGIAVILSLLLMWALLAAIYMAPAKFIGWFTDRFLTWGGAWRLSSAALLPGAVVMAVTVALYGWSVFDLVGLSFFMAVQVLIGWVYLIGGACKVTRIVPNDTKRNPFAA